jgi:signal transduction histidine kinase
MMFAVTVPLLIITYLQFRSLVTLGTTLPVYRKQVMREYLGAVSEEINNFYWEKANATLSIPGSYITNRKGGIIQEDYSKKVVQRSVAQVSDYFKGNDYKGVRRYFIVVVAERDGDTKNVTLFYDPERRKLVPDDQAEEWDAIQVAFASYFFYITRRASIEPAPQSVERNLDYPMIVKPILDEEKKIVALAGMVLDQNFFFDEFLPQAIHKYQRKYLPDDHQDAVVTLRDNKDIQWYSTASGRTSANELSAIYNRSDKLVPVAADEGKDEVVTSFPFVFRRMHLGMFMRHQTEAQWKQQYFIFNLSILILMSLMLIGGIVMALRTASREMKLSRMKADFVSNVSHELRTPLASIRVFGEFLKLGRVKDARKIQEYGEYIETESRRLTQLINNILDFSRIESGQKTYHFEDADLSEIVDETVKSFEVRLSQNGFKVTLEMPEEPMPLAKVDSSAIAQALVNLLDNAAKYSGDAREILIRVARKDQFITICVSDKGIGIPPPEQEKIFEKFYRVSTGLVHDVKGSGLGLSIVKHIVEAHQGKVTVRSKPGNGTTFTIYLPIRWVTGEIQPILDSGIQDSAPRQLEYEDEEELLVIQNK